MKNTWLGTLATLFLLPLNETDKQISVFHPGNKPVDNVFIITIDGYRWQEVFAGANQELIDDARYCEDAATTKIMYDAPDALERRKKLMPFFWNVIAKKGVLYGNRNFANNVNVANPYSLSYPGYSEMLTGVVDLTISSNNRKNNPNNNILAYLQTVSAYKDSIAVFTSWNVFPYILNAGKSTFPVNSGYQTTRANVFEAQLVSRVENQLIEEKEDTRYDELTFLAAKEYVKNRKPKILFLGLGETDEFAHRGRYDLYLQKANSIDKMIGELWYWVQTTPGYKDNTAFLITTDHGRGSKHNKWTSHGEFITGSSQTWLAAIGPGIPATGEMKNKNQLYQQQLAETIAVLLGERFLLTK